MDNMVNYNLFRLLIKVYEITISGFCLVPVHLPSGYILWVITGGGDIIVDQTSGAAGVPGFIPVEAEVEQLAVVGVGEGWVDDGDTLDDLRRCVVLVAAETVGQAF